MAIPREVYFEPDEYANRLRRVREAMGRHGIDLLVTCSPGNICYLNGYVSVNVLDIMFLCVPLEGDPLFYLWQFERGRADSTVVGGETVCWDTGVEPVGFVVNNVKRRRLDRGRVGVDTGSTHASYDVVSRLLDGLGADACTGVVESVRLVKSAAEQAYVREAAAMTDVGTRAAMATVHDGASDYEIAGAAESALLDAGCEFFALEPIVCVAWRSSAPHSPRGGTLVTRGDPVFIELSGVRARYHAPIMRTVTAGEPPTAVGELARYSDACVSALVEAIKPGALGSDVAAAGAKVLRPIRESLAFHDLFAYPVGIGFPPSWIENPAFYLSANNHAPLEAGMVFHLPLMLRRPGEFGAGFSETVIVSESGAEALSTLPRRLDQNG